MDSKKFRNYLFFHNFLYNKGAFKMQDKSRRLIAIPVFLGHDGLNGSDAGVDPGQVGHTPAGRQAALGISGELRFHVANSIASALVQRREEAGQFGGQFFGSADSRAASASLVVRKRGRSASHASRSRVS